MKIMITGGAGYIGSHIAHLLTQHGHTVVVVDDLSSGHRSALPKGCSFFQGDFADGQILGEIFSKYQIDIVCHCAAYVDVGESVRFPFKYFVNNFHKTQALVETMLHFNITKMIFSSTAGVYQSSQWPVDETAPLGPLSPYGQSKLASEWLIKSVAAANPSFRYITFRYFNVAGAEPDRSNGQTNPEATHLIKRGVLAALGKTQGFTIHGTDYETADGTCIRDFIHVKDLAQAHLAGFNYLNEGGPSETLNCGYMQGYSVQQVVNTLQSMAPSPFAVQAGPRRPGDLVQVVADNKRILKTLNWKPEYNSLEEICRSSLDWEVKLQNELHKPLEG